jgi:hypothetical protein
MRRGGISSKQATLVGGHQRSEREGEPCRRSQRKVSLLVNDDAYSRPLENLKNLREVGRINAQCRLVVNGGAGLDCWYLSVLQESERLPEHLQHGVTVARLYVNFHSQGAKNLQT